MAPSSARIRTFVRVRPFSEEELRSNSPAHAVVRCIGQRSIVFNPSSLKCVAPVVRFSTARGRQNYNQKHEFDSVFSSSASEDEVYETVALPLLRAAINGANASMFAYGATGCGKSHTINAIQDRLSVDIIRFLHDNREIVNLKMTYLQLYNEKIIDLLPSAEGRPLHLEIRDTLSNGGVNISGLAEHFPKSDGEIRDLFARGNRNRIIAATQANANSSRSHAVLTFTFEIRNTTSEFSRTSSLTIIDLAGSERAQSTRNRGERLNEGAKINKSLLALGNCITARAQKRQFIPYRESKLTRLLRFSLEGNCDTAMVVCVSPSLKHFDETKNSLEYGRRAALISHSMVRAAAHGVSQRQNMINELESQVAVLAGWKRDVIGKFTALLPELKANINKRGGARELSAEEFVQAILDTQGRPSPSDAHDSDLNLLARMSSLGKTTDAVDQLSVMDDVTIDGVSTKDSHLIASPEPFSPLKRNRRDVSAMHSRGTMLSSPQTVKRLHI